MPFHIIWLSLINRIYMKRTPFLTEFVWVRPWGQYVNVCQWVCSWMRLMYISSLCMQPILIHSKKTKQKKNKSIASQSFKILKHFTSWFWHIKTYLFVKLLLRKKKSLDKQHGSFHRNSLFNWHIMEISTVIAD